MGYARGERALGICDRCGFTYPLHDLSRETVNNRLTNTMTCPECFDEDHPQLHLDLYDFSDFFTLENPRPDTARHVGNSLGGWNPVRHVTVRLNIGSAFLR